jgi:hypothetical protein
MGSRAGTGGETIVVMAVVRLTLAVAVLTALSALAIGSRSAPHAHANGDPAFSLRNFAYDRAADLTEQAWINVNFWRVTVCTPRPARLRIRAIVDFDSPGEYRFVRRQPAGCTRYRLSAESDDFPEENTESRLRVAWRNHRQRTGWLEAGNPAPD